MTLNAATDDADMPTVALGSAGESAVEPELVVGAQVGRYVVVERVGQGGMARVVRAYDPKLGREVALKLLRNVGDATAHARMEREAQAMARLSHPNVVAVYDVDAHEGRPFIAMEYVQGQTLQQWLREQPRPKEEIVRAFVDAGRGLAAAHAIGLVHRDVKLANLLRGDDGRVRVTDFGIARMLEQVSSADHESVETDVSDDSLTQAGTVVGTPPYMAPEQHDGRSPDARSDQYGFCVALWEALTGKRPFLGSDARTLIAAKKSLSFSSPPGRSIPSDVRAAVLRGLAPDPADRHASMEDLVDALARGRRRQRVLRASAGAGAVAVCLAVVYGAVRWDREQDVRACAAQGAAIDDVWNDGTRTALRGALASTGVAHADITADKVMPWLDRQAESWRTEATAACMDATVNDRWDADMLGRSQWCLDERKLQLEAVVAQLGQADAKAVDRAVKTAAGLQRVEPCRDEALLARLPAPPTEGREAVEAVRRDLSRASAMQGAGAYAAAIPIAEDALARAESLGWPPLVVAAQRRLGGLHDDTGDYDAAAAELEEAYFAGVEAGALDDALDCVEKLSYIAGYRRRDHAEAIRWSRHAELLLVTQPDPLGSWQIRHLTNRSMIEHMASSYEQAKTLQEQALTLAESLHGADHPDVADIRASLANEYAILGMSAEAKAMHESVLAIREATLGKDHPYIADTLNNLATVEYMLGNYAEAQRLLERSIAINENVHGPHHNDVASGLANLGTVLMVMGEYERAHETHERAMAIKVAILGAEHPEVGSSLNNIALIENTTGADDDAKAKAQRAIAIWEKAIGPEHSEIGLSLNIIATVARRRGEFAAARRDQERAVAIFEKALGPDHYQVSLPLVGLAEIAMAEHRHADAVKLAERALGQRERGSAPLDQLAEARFVLARALAKAGKSGALALATQAREDYGAAGSAFAPVIIDIDAFLREQNPK